MPLRAAGGAAVLATRGDQVVLESGQKLEVTLETDLRLGWLAGLVMKAMTGLLANILIGIVDSALGSWPFGVLGFAAYGAIAR